jgi:hypothetical protein
MALSKVMISVNWLNPTQKHDALDILQRWEVPAPMQALELLDARFGEYRVREFAVHCLEPFDDEELSDFLLQLIQASTCFLNKCFPPVFAISFPKKPFLGVLLSYFPCL